MRWLQLRWYLQVWFSRRGLGHGSTSRVFTPLVLLTILAAGLILLRTIWNILMKGFLGAAPLVPGSQVGTYYWNSALFAFKSTLLIGGVLILVTFFLGMHIKGLLKR